MEYIFPLLCVSFLIYLIGATGVPDVVDFLSPESFLTGAAGGGVTSGFPTFFPTSAFGGILGMIISDCVQYFQLEIN